MRFELKDEYLHWGEVKFPTLCELALPSGVIKVAIVISGKKAVVSGFGRKCSVFNEPRIPALLFSGAGFLPKGICGDAIITMHEMGYDLTSKDDIKKAIKHDREKIVAEYEKLVSEKPELFDASKVDLKKIELLSKDSQSEPKPSDTQTVSSGSETSEEKSQTIQENKPEEQIEKKVENVDESIKKLDEKLKTDESTESVEETSSDELKELEELKDAGILTEEEFQKKKEEILSQDSTTSQIEEETTPDKIVCDICKGEEWDEEDEGSDELHQTFDEDDFEFEEPLALWCVACVDFMKKLTEKIDLEDFGEDYENKGFVLSSEDYEDIISEGKMGLILDALRDWKSR